MEIERPCCYTECCDAVTSWDEYGMRIKWTEPPVPGESKIDMLDHLTLKLCLECKKPLPIRDVKAFAWTHVFHKDNPEGIYREIELVYDPTSRKWDDWGVTTYEFSAVIYPTHNDDFRLTYNVKYGKVMIWANVFQIDHVLTVCAAAELNSWTKMPRLTQITQRIYLGNYLSVMLAEEQGFTAIMYLSSDTEYKINVDHNFSVIYKLSDLKRGTGNAIYSEEIKDMVAWLMEANAKCHKILIGDHDGHGRVGSAMTAYIFANNRNLTFDEAYDFVKSRVFLCCHKGLKDILYRLYPRD